MRCVTDLIRAQFALRQALSRLLYSPDYCDHVSELKKMVDRLMFIEDEIRKDLLKK